MEKKQETATEPKRETLGERFKREHRNSYGVGKNGRLFPFPMTEKQFDSYLESLEKKNKKSEK